MTLVGLLNDFLLQKKIGGLSPKTIDSYKNALHVFVLYAGDSLSLKELTQDLVNAYILDLYDRDLSRATVSTYVRSLKIFLRWIHQEYTLCFDPTKIKIPKSPKKIVHIYSDSEIRLIFSVIQNISSTPWINARNAAMVSLMLDSGIRQCEVCGLLRENMDFSGGRMKVLGKGAKERIVPLGKLSQTLLARYLAMCPHDNKRFVFCDIHGRQISGNAIRLFTYDLQSRLPFEFSSHKLRHTSQQTSALITCGHVVVLTCMI